MKKFLEVGDIVIASNPLFKNGERECLVTKIEGNKAITDFRTFNRKIYAPNMVYEFGKRYDPYDNGYWLKQEE